MPISLLFETPITKSGYTDVTKLSIAVHIYLLGKDGKEKILPLEKYDEQAAKAFFEKWYDVMSIEADEKEGYKINLNYLCLYEAQSFFDCASLSFSEPYCAVVTKGGQEIEVSRDTCKDILRKNLTKKKKVEIKHSPVIHYDHS